MGIKELESRLRRSRIGRMIDQIEILEGSRFQMILIPHTAVTEQFVQQLEAALGQRLKSFLVSRRQSLLVRFTLESDDDPESPHIAEVPWPEGWHLFTARTLRPADFRFCRF